MTEKRSPETVSESEPRSLPEERPPSGPEPAAGRAQPVGPFQAVREGAADEPLPLRYEIREGEEVRYLRCWEAPSLGVSIDRSYAVTEAEARKLGQRVILLDGAGQFEPLLDDSRQLYNLDHHQGCLRAFTLATCEQALILVLQGLELDRGDWKIYANEPDLDTLFAIWVLLNYRYLRDLKPEGRDSIVPLLRLEGAIDANGFEIAEYCGLPQEVLAAEKAKLDRLHQRELELKRSGEWADGDLTHYALEMLAEIDRLVFSRDDVERFASMVEEYGHVEIGATHSAVLCRDDAGIYEVEKRLKKVWGDRLGVIALEREPRQYTLRRVAPLAGIDLGRAYDMLNRLDPAVDGRPPEKRWGGSDDIGGSPRPSGTGLEPREIRRILRLAYAEPSAWARLRHLGQAVLGALAAGVAGVAGFFLWDFYRGMPEATTAHAGRLAAVAVMALLAVTVLSSSFSGRRLWLHGWRRPAGQDWLLLVPAALVGAGFGGVWIPALDWAWPGPPPEPAAFGASLGALLAVAAAAEVTFRGLGHGLLLLDGPVQCVSGRWFVSRAVLVSAVLYTLGALAAWHFGLLGAPVRLSGVLEGLLVAAAALVTGLALGMIRERSTSLWPGVVAHLVGCLLRLSVEIRLSG